MELSIIGSIKVDSRLRKKLFTYSLASLESVSSLLSWQLNIVGKYANFARKAISEVQLPTVDRDKDRLVTINDDSSYYQIIKNQIKNSESNLLFFWQEDHWFLCPQKNLFLYLLDEFSKSKAEILTISHLITSWEAKRHLPIVKDSYLYKEYRVDFRSQKELWQKYPKAYLTGIPAIYKKALALEILEFNKPYLSNSKLPYGYELDSKRGRDFLKNRSFIEMIPKFHIFREVFRFKPEKRAITMKEALQILKLREKGSF